SQEALTAFDHVFGEVPGEVVPKLAIATVYELAGDPENAIVYYGSALRTDPQLTAAAFGLSRANLMAGPRGDAVAARAQVPATSIRYTQAQMALAHVLLGDDQAPANLAELEQAAAVIEGLAGLVSGIALHQLRADLFRAAADAVEAGRISSD